MDGSIINIIIGVYVTPAVNRKYNGTFLHQHNYIAGLSNLSHSTKETKDGVTPNSETIVVEAWWYNAMMQDNGFGASIWFTVATNNGVNTPSILSSHVNRERMFYNLHSSGNYNGAYLEASYNHGVCISLLI